MTGSVPTTDAQHDRRWRWKLGVCVGGLLALAGAATLVLVVLGMLRSLQVIETKRAPTPADLAAGPEIVMIAFVVGPITGLTGVVLLLVSALKLRRGGDATLPPASEEEPGV